jgi:hypothetical protein
MVFARMEIEWEDLRMKSNALPNETAEGRGTLRKGGVERELPGTSVLALRAAYGRLTRSVRFRARCVAGGAWKRARRSRSTGGRERNRREPALFRARQVFRGDGRPVTCGKSSCFWSKRSCFQVKDSRLFGKGSCFRSKGSRLQSRGSRFSDKGSCFRSIGSRLCSKGSCVSTKGSRLSGKGGCFFRRRTRVRDNGTRLSGRGFRRLDIGGRHPRTGGTFRQQTNHNR